MTPYLVGIAGGTGAGKTALADALTTALGTERVVRLAQDAYYRDRSNMDPDQRADLNFDVPEALDLDLFHTHLASLRAGQPIEPPRYCFATHCRLRADGAVAPRDVVLVEGILLLSEPRLRTLLDLRIYVDAPADVRLARRIARDIAERGRTPESVLAQCRATVWPAHARHVEPFKGWAELVLINTGPLQAAVEVAAAVILARLAQRPSTPAKASAA